jgi:hypothetical protein
VHLLTVYLGVCMAEQPNIQDNPPAKVPPAVPKEVIASKVVWFNAFVTLAALLSLLAASDAVSAELSKILLLIVGGVNIILRIWFTAEPIKAKV